MIRSFYWYFIIAIIFTACNAGPKKEAGTVAPAFYHWKTSFAPTQSEWDIIHHNKVKDLYIRFFDVAWDPTYGKPAPVAQLRVIDKNIFSKEKINVIPTVFITNECIRYIQPEQCKPLAEKIYQLISSIVTVNAMDSVSEIQVDCDWTNATKEKYFSLLTHMQEIDTTHLYSATIRLFQVKYKNDAGIPPVKKGLLMCYNMGDLKDPMTGNSIIDPATVKKYTTHLQDYPLPLDVALPVFSWYVLFRSNEYKGLMQEPGGDFFANSSTQGIAGRYNIQADTIWNNIHFKKGDLIRYESSSFSDIIKVAGILKDKLPGRKLRLSLYHLDSITLSKYSAHEMEAIFRSLY